MNMKEIKEWLYTIGIAVVLVIIIRAFILDTRIVPSTSMVPSIVPGDRLFVEKITHHISGLDRGEVVVFEPPPASGLTDDLIKRLIALPGDTVEVKDGKLYLNDVPQEEAYIPEPIEYTYEKQVVPPGKIFVMGDNRNRSYDSHEWGFVDIDSVEGKALLTYWPFDRIRFWWKTQG
ncbi:MAG: signal peptidase I [Clostridia bacterium]|jgi:signal peptidase I|nr:signal peptidase I [Clostridia bacterium]